MQKFEKHCPRAQVHAATSNTCFQEAMCFVFHIITWMGIQPICIHRRCFDWQAFGLVLKMPGERPVCHGIWAWFLALDTDSHVATNSYLWRQWQWLQWFGSCHTCGRPGLVPGSWLQPWSGKQLQVLVGCLSTLEHSLTLCLSASQINKWEEFVEWNGQMFTLV